jgi:hypothetical protein
MNGTIERVSLDLRIVSSRILPFVTLFHFVSPLQAFGNTHFIPSQMSLRMFRLAHLSIKIMNLQAESALSTAPPPPSSDNNSLSSCVQSTSVISLDVTNAFVRLLLCGAVSLDG